MMPSIMNMARRRSRVFQGGLEMAINDAVGTAWMIIRTFPHQRRPRKIAANIAKDTEYYAFVRQHRLKRVKEQQVGDEILRGVFEYPQTHGDSEDFDNAMAEAEESGVKAHHIELLNRLANGEHSRDIAAAEGVSPRTVRQHRKDAVDEVRRVLLNN
jgi:DNA-binding CsgD family transcriptional regulator